MDCILEVFVRFYRDRLCDEWNDKSDNKSHNINVLIE